MASQGAETSGGSLQKRVSDQRARLLALEYHEPFTVESLPLVERLFADLVTTTESYDDLQQREEQAAAELALNRAQLFPLKKDNARLLRDNNLLHLKVIKTAEDAEAAERSALLLGKRNDVAREEKNILAKQKDDRIVELEKQVDELRDKLSGALDDVAGQRATGRSSSLHRELEVSDTLAAHERTLSAERIVRDGSSSRAPEDERLSNLAETLRRKLEEASAVISGLEGEKRRLRGQVESREEEIARLGKQISAEGNLNLDKVTLAHAHEANQRIVEQLNDQVDFLNKQLALRESQLHKTQDENEKLVSEPAVARLEVDRLRDVSRELEQDNVRLREAVDALEKAASEDRAGPRGTSASGARLETVAVGGDGSPDDGARTAVLEREKGQLVEALSEAVRERGIAEESLEKARSETRDLAREVELLKETCRDMEERRLAEVGGADAFARERERVFVDLGQTREEAHELKAEVARLRAEAEARVAQAGVLGRERDVLLEKLRELSEKMRNDAKAAEEIESRHGEEMEATALRREHEARERRATGERLSLAGEREEFLAQEAHAARLERDRAERRAEAAEARTANVANDVKELERALQTEELRARSAEGEAADLRTAVGTVGWDHGDRETIIDYERKLEESETARERLADEIERLTGQGSLLGVERTAQQARLGALERERSNLSEHLKARDRDMETVLEQKRSLEAEVARAQRALSRGAVESASRAQGELVLQARVEEMGEELRTLRSETGELRDRLLDEERKSASARDEADRLVARLSHRDTGLEGLEAEATSLRAELGVARAEFMEAEVARSRSEAEGERLRTSAEALESQLGVMKENVADKDQEIRRLKTLARQLEGSRESLKASTDQAHAALRDAELRVGQASASGDAAVRELESRQAEVTQLKDALADLDGDRDRLQDTLDQQTERLVELQQEKEQLVLKAAQAGEKAREEGSRCSELEAALERAERRMKEAEAKSAEGLARIEALSSELSNKSGQLSAAVEDLELMAKENQAVTADLSRLGAEKEDDRRRLGDALHKAATAEQAVRVAQFEKEDILKNYKGLHAEKRRLEAGMDELQLARQRLTKSLAERDTEVSKLRASCNTLEVELQRRAMDLGAAQRQAEDLSEKLLRCGRHMEALAAENRKLDSDHRAQRHHANALLERIRSQQGQSASAGQEVSSLRSRLQVLEEERNGLSHILGRERSHGTGLEQLIEASRLREASMAAEQRQLLREKQQLEAKAVRLSQELSQARECLADLSSRVSDSRQDSRHPADVVGSPSTSASVVAAAPGAAPTAAAWDRHQPDTGSRSQTGGLVEGLESALGGGLFSDIGSESSVGASPAPPGRARKAFSRGRQERTPFRAGEHSTATAMAGGSDHAGNGNVARGGGTGGRSDQVEHKEEDSVVFDLEDMRGFIRQEGQRLRERVRERRGR